ncbi:PUR-TRANSCRIPTIONAL ACTIVATOR [Salix viminalis]|uniref:PUR-TRANSCRIPTIONAL ACTIVATOR n=1 Tax=Salix viminalis TaxID=40686 RepID=A0A9Q0TMB6_SALVM|nr:PUR-TRANSCRIPTIONAL ACTIVATOR [Salix viminalis]
MKGGQRLGTFWLRSLKHQDFFMLPNQSSETSEHLVGLSDDVGAGFISGQGSQAPAPTSELNVDRSVELAPQDEISNLGVSKVIRVDQKRFFFDLGSNNRGHFLRISEGQESYISMILCCEVKACGVHMRS